MSGDGRIHPQERSASGSHFRQIEAGIGRRWQLNAATLRTVSSCMPKRAKAAISPERRGATPPIRTLAQLVRLTPRQADTRGRALDALSEMRRNPKLSLTRAAQDAETTPGAVRRYAGSSLTRERGRLRTTTTDRLYRNLQVAIDTPGMRRGGALGGEVRNIGISSSRTASAVGRHWSALQRYLHHGDYAALAKYRGRTFTADGVTYTFLTDRDKIAELADLGVFDQITDIYVNAA